MQWEVNMTSFYSLQDTGATHFHPRMLWTTCREWTEQVNRCSLTFYRDRYGARKIILLQCMKIQSMATDKNFNNSKFCPNVISGVQKYCVWYTDYVVMMKRKYLFKVNRWTHSSFASLFLQSLQKGVKNNNNNSSVFWLHSDQNNLPNILWIIQNQPFFLLLYPCYYFNVHFHNVDVLLRIVILLLLTAHMFVSCVHF